jgi:acetate---CoA ligase (ADP-forming)
VRFRPESIKPIFDPASIAIIGASDNIQKFGGRPIRYMKEGGYKGRLYPINPKGGEIQGLPAYADVREVGQPIDMAIVSVPAAGVVSQIEACAEAGVRSAVIFSSGFAETSAEGRDWQNRLKAIARESGIRLVGPNCMGMLNAASRAVGTFSSCFDHGWPKPGKIAILSQSGAVGSHTLVLARNRGLGIRGWITTGNECDVDVADCMLFAAQDPETEVLAIYMEGCQNPDSLVEALETARRHRKPVIVLKVGASEVGAIAASTHTASLAGSDAVFDSVYRQYGAYRVHSLQALLEVAGACAAGQYPAGNRLGVATISGGAGVMACDAAAANGLEVPALPEAAQKKLKDLMPFAAVRNPVDTTAQVLNDFDLLRQNIEVLLTDGKCDVNLLFLSSIGFSPVMMPKIIDLLPKVRQKFPDELIVFSAMLKPEDKAFFESLKFLCIEDPTRAIEIIGALVKIGQAFARGPGAPPPALPKSARPAPAKVLNEIEAGALLRDAGLPVLESRLATSAEEAEAAAEELGFPAVLKVVSAVIQHKSEVGGVRLGLGDADAVRDAYEGIMASVAEKAPGAAVDGVMVAPMASGGVETILGVHADPVFGPVVMFGLGGIFVEVLKDVTFRVAPFGVDEARRMIREVKGYPLLEGVRGQPPADLEALAEALALLSVFAHENREAVAGVDLNPFLVRPKGQGAVALDALVQPKGA